MTAYESLVAAEKALTSQSEAEKYLTTQGFKLPKAHDASARFWKERHPPPPPPPPTDDGYLPMRPNLSRIFHDPCDSDPVPIYGGVVAERRDGKTQETYKISEIIPDRLQVLLDANGSFRRSTPQPGDHTWGSRAVCGFPDADQPCALYREGNYYRTTFHVRFPVGHDINRGGFHQIMEQKQCAPFPDAHGGAYWNAIEVRAGSWLTEIDWGANGSWAAPFEEQLGTLIPITIEGVYAEDPSKGWLRHKCGRSVSPVMRGKTFWSESPAKYLQLGVYRDPAYPADSFDYFNVEVYKGPAITP